MSRCKKKKEGTYLSSVILTLGRGAEVEFCQAVGERRSDQPGAGGCERARRKRTGNGSHRGRIEHERREVSLDCSTRDEEGRVRRRRESGRG